MAKGFEARNKEKLSVEEIDKFMQNCVNLALQTAPNLITARLLEVELDKRDFVTTNNKLIYKQLETNITKLFADGYLELPELMYSEKPKTAGLDSTYTPFAEENIIEGTPTGKGTVLTLSNGRYDEFLTTKKIEAIGSVRFNTEKNKIVGFGENKRQVEVVSRFLSVDPLSQEYPWNSPYAFAENSPIEYIDLDGLEKLDFRTHFAMSNGNAGLAVATYVTDWFTSSFYDYAAAGADLMNNDVSYAQNKQSTQHLNDDGLQEALAKSHQERKYRGYAQATQAGSDIVEKSYTVMGALETAAVLSAGKVVVGEALKKNQKAAVQKTQATQQNVADLTVAKSNVLPKMDRVKKFVSDLKNANPVSNVEDAVKLINKTLDDIEDAYSGVAKNPDAINMPNIEDGRMYGFLDNKYIKDIGNGQMCGKTRKNVFIFDSNGGFKLYVRDKNNKENNEIGALIMEKSGTPPKTD